MIVSADALRRDTVALIREIDKQIKEVEAEAQRRGIPASKVRDTTDNWVLNPLLLAKAMAYNTLVTLQSK